MNTFYDIFSKYPEVREVHIFGSRATGKYKFGSDIDLAIVNEGVNFNIITKLYSEFEESSLPYTVDLVDLRSLSHQDLKNHIDRIGKVFYEAKTHAKVADPLAEYKKK